MRDLVLVAFLTVSPFFILAQTAAINGRIMDEEGKPVGHVRVELLPTAITVHTDEGGNFSIRDISYGIYSLYVSVQGKESYVREITVNQPVVDLGIIELKAIHQLEDDDIPVITLTDDELKGSSVVGAASVLSASRDPFITAASFNFSIARFRPRGYDDENTITLINAIPMNDLVTGRNMYYRWSGLNDVMRSREHTYGLASSNYVFGVVGGSSFIDCRATRQRKQWQATYSLSNRVYDNRLMLTYGSGMLNNGWSFALSGSKRWAEEGYVEGTFYDGYSLFGTVEKLYGLRHSLSLTAFGVHTLNGRSSPVVQELYDLAGTNYYNPNWGWQNGKKRNATVANNTHLSTILMHEFKMDSRQWWTTAVAYLQSLTKNSGLDWYNAPDPRPDYYRNLPSFFSDFPAIQQQLIQLYQQNDTLLQINWQALYQANAMSDTTLQDANGIAGNILSGKWSRYIIEDRVNAIRLMAFNSYYNRLISHKFTLTAGLTYSRQQSDFYKEVNDLLGGDFYVDLNHYAEMDNPGNVMVIQNDLNRPNRILKKGDRFGYDYTAHITKMNSWLQLVFRQGRWETFVSGEASHSSLYRQGKMRNGLFPENSYGNSETKSYLRPAFKGGIIFKLDGRNFLLAHTAILSRAPFFENAFISPRVNNVYVHELTTEKIHSAEGGYLMKAPRMKIRLMAYYTTFYDATETRSFFNEATNSFGNLTLTNIDKRHTGMEAGMDINVGKGFSAFAAASLGRFYYSSRPLATFTEDESSTPLYSNQIIYARGLHLGSLPQTAMAAGISYRSPQFWLVSLSMNYFDHIFIQFSPVRRTTEALDLLDAGTPPFEKILRQERLSRTITFDFFSSWSYRLNRMIPSMKKNSFFVIYAGINNLTNVKNFRTGGYEQLRFDFREQNPDKYPPKYFYAPGRTFFISFILRFN
jgi:hypothetical protein